VGLVYRSKRPPESAPSPPSPLIPAFLVKPKKPQKSQIPNNDAPFNIFQTCHKAPIHLDKIEMCKENPAR
jgi:hypothetical protein